MQSSTTTAPRVCVQCLAAYNNGRLHFEWVEVTANPDDLYAHIRRVLASSPEPDAEEWEFADYEGLPRGVWASSSPEVLAAWVAELEEADGYGISEDTLAEYWERDTYQDVEGIAEKCRDALIGEYDDLGDFAYEWAQNTYGLNIAADLGPGAEPGLVAHYENLLNNVDWDAIGRDRELNGDVFTLDAPHGIYVFAA